MIWSIAWRNVWRNKIRSLVVIMAVTMGMFGGTFSVGLMNGAIKGRINEAVNNESAHIQVHNPLFNQNNEIIYTLNDVDKMMTEIEALAEVKAVSKRFKILNSAQTAHNSTGIVLYSVDPEKEKLVTSMHEKIDTGSYFTESKKPQVIISQRTAKKLKAKVGSKIIMTLTRIDTTAVYANFKVTGIYKTSNGMFDSRTAFTRNSDMEGLIGLQSNQAHELIIRLQNHDDLDAAMEKLQNLFPEQDVQSWVNLVPDVGMLVEMGEFMLYIIILIILLALSFGIVNTMMMAVMERRKELGMLMAVGMTQRRVFTMIMLETVFLSVFGALLGTFFGGLVISITGAGGIDFSQFAEGFEQVGYASIVYPELEWQGYLIILSMVIFVAIAACIYPARKALKLKPVEALKIDN